MDLISLLARAGASRWTCSKARRHPPSPGAEVHSASRTSQALRKSAPLGVPQLASCHFANTCKKATYWLRSSQNNHLLISSQPPATRPSEQARATQDLGPRCQPRQ